MPLQFQLQSFPFRSGLQEGVDPRQVPPGTLVTAENARWSKTGRIEKRHGTTLFNYNGAEPTGGIKRLFTRGSELVVVDGQNAYSYSPTKGLLTVDSVTDVAMQWQTFLDATYGAHAFDIAVNGTVLLCAWVSGASGQIASGVSGDVYFAAYDTATSSYVLPPAQLTTTTDFRGVRVVSNGTDAFIVSHRTATTTLRVAAVSLASYTVQLWSTLRTDVRAGYGWDAAIDSLGRLVIAYEQTGGAGPIKVYWYTYTAPTTYTQSGTRTSPMTGNSFVSLALCVDSNNNAYFAAACQSRGQYSVDFNGTVADVLAASALMTGTSTTSRVSLILLNTNGANGAIISMFDSANVDNLRPTRGVITVKLSGAGVADTTTTRGTANVMPASRLFALGGRFFQVVCDYDSGASTYHTYSGTSTHLVEVLTTDKASLSDFVPHKYLGKIDHLVGATTIPQSLCSGVAMSSSSAYVFTPFMSAVTTNSEVWRLGVRAVNVTLAGSHPADMYRGASYGGEAYFCSGSLMVYDGAQVFEYGFPQPPTFGASGFANAGGGALENGTHLWAAVGEFRSAAGVLHRSAPATMATTWSNGTNPTVSFYVGTPSTTRRETPARGWVSELLAVYRTVTGGTTYYRWTYDPRYGANAIDARLPYVQISDAQSDASLFSTGVPLARRPLLYTTGGILDDDAPPSVTTMAIHKSRLWCVDGSGTRVWFSKSFLDDAGTAPGFSPSFVVNFEETVTALASMDEKLIAFSAGRFWYLVGGDNITPNGAQSDLQGPIQIQSDVGCTNPRSVVSTPDGVMFQSARGLYLLTRGLELVWIGRPIKDKLAAYPYITSAVMVPRYSEIRFTANSGPNNTGNGIVFVYNYVEKQWTTSVYKNISTGAPIADAVLWNDTYVIAERGDSSGSLLLESESSYLDQSSWVPMTLETAWISASGPLAFQSVRLMDLEGISHTNHDLTLSVYTDGDVTSARQTVTFLAGSAVTAVGPLEECSVTIGTWRKCKHIRFRIQDATPTSPGTYPVTTGQGPSFDSMGIEFGMKKGFASNPATKKG